MKAFVFLVSLFFLSAQILVAQTQYFTSTKERTSIIELFSSEGCNSCPSAEAWVNELKNSPEVFKSFIPMVFHVTYWDRLGWKDIFAQKRFDERQYEYSTLWGKNGVYTPNFVINAKEYRRWFYNKSIPSFERVESGVLKVSLDERFAYLRYASDKKVPDLIVNIASLGFGYTTKVERGENKGKILVHDFVVLEHKAYRMFSKNGYVTGKFSKPKLVDDEHKKALVVWLSDAKGEILQAVGGYIEP